MGSSTSPHSLPNEEGAPLLREPSRLSLLPHAKPPFFVLRRGKENGRGRRNTQLSPGPGIIEKEGGAPMAEVWGSQGLEKKGRKGGKLFPYGGLTTNCREAYFRMRHGYLLPLPLPSIRRRAIVLVTSNTELRRLRWTAWFFAKEKKVARAGGGGWRIRKRLTLIRWNHIPSATSNEHDFRPCCVERVCWYTSEC